MVRRYGATTLLGAIWALVAWLLTPALLPWLAPVLLGLLLAIPLALLSGRADLGPRRAPPRLVSDAEEIRPPRELACLGEAAAAEERPDPGVGEAPRGVPAIG